MKTLLTLCLLLALTAPAMAGQCVDHPVKITDKKPDDQKTPKLATPTPGSF